MPCSRSPRSIAYPMVSTGSPPGTGQAEQLGTGHAVLAAREALEGHAGDVVVLYGDTPFVQAETIVEPGAIDPDAVHTPGVYVTHVTRAVSPTDIEQRTVRPRPGSADQKEA